MRAWQAYQTSCVIAVNGVLLLALTCALSTCWTDPRDTYWQLAGGVPRYSSRFVLANYRQVPAAAARETAQEFDRYAEDGHWQVAPWTALGNRAFAGRQLNVSADGERLVPDPDATRGGKTVWLLGGSTVFGWGLPDAYTLPARLRDALRRRGISGLAVRNLGAPFYNSSHETALFVAALREGHPVAAVFFDGLNDYAHHTYYRDEAPLVKLLARAWEHHVSFTLGGVPSFELSPNFPLMRFVYRVGALRAEGGMEPSETPAAAGVERAIAAYVANHRSVDGVARAHGVPVLSVLQPVPRYLGTDRRTPTETGYARFVRAVRDQAPDVVDLTASLAALSGELPLSVEGEKGTHYSDIASEFLAERLVDLVIPLIRDSSIRLDRVGGQ